MKSINKSIKFSGRTLLKNGIFALIMGGVLISCSPLSNLVLLPPTNLETQEDPEIEQMQKHTANVIWYLGNYLNEKITNILSEVSVAGFVPATLTFSENEINLDLKRNTALLDFEEYEIGTGTLHITIFGEKTADNTYVCSKYAVSTTDPIVVTNGSGEAVPYTVTVPETPITGQIIDGYWPTVTGFSDFTLFTSGTTITANGQPVDISEYLSKGSIFDSGNGKSEETAYAISNAEQLVSMFSSPAGTYFQLSNDISIDNSGNLGYLNGNLDGNGHTIILVGDSSDDELDYSPNLFTSLRSNASIKNITFDFGNSGNVKTLIACTSGPVTLENVRIEGTIIADGNNIAPFIGNIGFSNDVGGEGVGITETEILLKNCTNAVDIIDSTGTHWGISPFIGGNIISLSGATNKIKITLENCKNEGTITGGEVGWAVGNGSNLEKISSFTMTGCSNINGGSVTGYIKAGDISDDGSKDVYTNANFTVTDSANLVTNKSDLVTTSSFTYKEDGTLKYTIDSSLLNEVYQAEIIARYSLVTYVGTSATSSTKIGEMNNLETSDTVKLNTITGITSKHPEIGDVSKNQTGDIITVGNEQYVYIASPFDPSWAYFITTKDNNTGTPSTVFMVLRNQNDEIIAVIQGSKA